MAPSRERAMRARALRFLLAAVALLYLAFLLLFLCEPPSLSRRLNDPASASASAASRPIPLSAEEDTLSNSAPARPFNLPRRLSLPSSGGSALRRRRSPIVSGLEFRQPNGTTRAAFSQQHRAAWVSWEAGRKLFEEMESALPPASPSPEANRKVENCPRSVSLTGEAFEETGRLMVLPCGLTLGSHITVVARPRPAHDDNDPKIAVLKEGERAVLVSQFAIELLGLKAVDGEVPPKIFHFNPRLKGDWSGKPVIEQNSCYRMQWGMPLRCEGWKSRDDEDTVDGQVKCEKWIHGDGDQREEEKMSGWMSHLIGTECPYPFEENKMFVLTLTAGLEGYHVNVDGQHVSSFPYRTGFGLEDATGLSLNGDIDVQSISAASLPNSYSSFAPQRHLEMSAQWKTPPLTDEPTELFIGILSAANHFAERMAMRKSWMAAVRGRSSNIVARFFVALHGRKEVNLELKKEAEFFGDIVLVPFMDSYDLVVMKTIAICEYGARVVSAKYIMKCDDDTFVRIDSVMEELKKIPSDRSLYMGNMNYYHKPQRNGKWVVTLEEWPEEVYPPYANGPGYILSYDIANFVVSEFENHTIRLFKMEDVSMGMWVEKFGKSRPVECLHNYKFCQFGCIDDYYTAHYQSPRQMICLWDKLQAGKAQCCNMR